MNSPEAVTELLKLEPFGRLKKLAVIVGFEFSGAVKKLAQWIIRCRNLCDLQITLRKEEDLEVLVDQGIQLRHLDITSRTIYTQKKRGLYKLLASQPSLQSLTVKIEGTSYPDTLVEVVSKLDQLRKLDLTEDVMTMNHIRTLMPHLPKLESLTLNGIVYTDEIWPLFSGLKNLRYLCLTSKCMFTAQGMHEFVSQLGLGNWGLMVLFFHSTGPYDNMSLDEISTASLAIKQKVNGKFVYSQY